jgi:hypothetical protein
MSPDELEFRGCFDRFPLSTALFVLVESFRPLIAFTDRKAAGATSRTLLTCDIFVDSSKGVESPKRLF